LKNSDKLITNEGELEVVLLYETHDLLAELISDNYYFVGDPAREIRFNDSSSFWNFFVHVQELIEEGDNVRVGNVKRLSLLGGIAWLCSVYPDEALQVGLGQATTDLVDWISAERDVTFWCGDLGKTISLKMSRGRLINFAANYSKHGLLRTRRLMQGLSGYTEASGLGLSLAELASLRDSFRGEIENRLLYLSSWLVELIGAFWYALNELVVRRLAVQNTNDETFMGPLWSSNLTNESE
jgi:hypothetical protein